MSVAEVLSGRRRWHVEQGDCVAFLDALPADSCSLVFGSPPYEQARLYLEDGRDIGIARDTEAWVAWMLTVYRAALRCCNGLVAFVVEGQTRGYRYSGGPVLLWADLIRAGITTRKAPVYHRVGIPGSGGKDWLRNDYEFIVCATRGGRLPWSDNTACGHPPKWQPGGEISHRLMDGSRANGNKERKHRTQYRDGKGRMITIGLASGKTEVQSYIPPALANPGNVIDCVAGGGTMGSRLCHFSEAPFPEALAEFFVRSFCPPGGLVVDCFAGSGTTGAVAVRNGRRFLGCDLRPSQVLLGQRRISGETPTMFPDGVEPGGTP